MTRPLRALGRGARALTSVVKPDRPDENAPAAERPVAKLTEGRYDSWLEHFHGPRLDRINAACENGDPESYASFRSLDADLWALLLTQEYTVYPDIRSLLPDVPDVALQQAWNGSSGAVLANQSKSFYSKLKARFSRYGNSSLADARVLDFGCGWGRLTRFLARDVRPGRLHGCDPVEEILDVCRRNGVPARLARSEFLPDRLPFEEQFDLIFAFSVFTHISEAAHESCLRTLHRALSPGGILVVTVRPPEYLHFCERLHPLLESLGPDYRARLKEPRYLFVSHPAEPRHPQYAGGEMTYGETVITLPYVRERWSTMFELLEVDVLIADLHQIVLTLRRR